MRDLKNKLTSGKNTKNIQPKKGKMFGYQVLGFGSGGAGNLIEASGGTISESGDFRTHIFTFGTILEYRNLSVFSMLDIINFCSCLSFSWPTQLQQFPR